MAKKTKTTPTTDTQRPPRLAVIDMMIGIAMILVVLGHQTVPFSPRWYDEGLHEWIYMFHMELFMFLSAFLIRYSYRGVKSVGDYGRYIWRKFVKFFVPFLVIGLVVSLASAYERGVAMDNMWGVALDSLRRLLLYPIYSDASFLWYIYILFGFYLVSPLVIMLPRWVKMVLCVATLALPLLNAGQLLGAGLFCKYAFFYMLGILCGEGYEELRNVKTWVWGLLAIPFAVWSVLVFIARLGGQLSYPWLTVAPWQFHIVEPCLALPFFYFLGRLLTQVGWVNKVLSAISHDCFWIYLLQMFVVWTCYFALQGMGFEGRCPFWLFLIVSTVLGIAVPMAVERVSRYLPSRRSSHKDKKK